MKVKSAVVSAKENIIGATITTNALSHSVCIMLTSLSPPKAVTTAEDELATGHTKPTNMLLETIGSKAT